MSSITQIYTQITDDCVCAKIIPLVGSTRDCLFQYRYFGIGLHQYRNTGFETGIEIHHYNARQVVQGGPALATVMGVNCTYALYLVPLDL